MGETVTTHSLTCSKNVQNLQALWPFLKQDRTGLNHGNSKHTSEGDQHYSFFSHVERPEGPTANKKPEIHRVTSMIDAHHVK